MIAGILGLLALVLSTAVVAPVQGAETSQEAVAVRTEVRPAGEVWVGQRTSIYVTVVMPQRPDRSPRFSLSRVPGALFRQSPGSPVLGSENTERGELVLQRFELLLFPQRAGEITVPPVGVRVAMGGEIFELATEPVTVAAKLPEGVSEGTQLITTRELEISQAWDPEPSELVVGEAFKRTITIRARDVLGVAIPPAPVPHPDGLAAYPADPITDDSLQRGTLQSTRTDVVTYVSSAAGSYELPGMVYRWWDPQRLVLEERELSGVRFEVRPDPHEESVTAVDDGSFTPGLVVAGVALLVTLLCLLARRRIASHWHGLRARRTASEPARFRRLARACRTGEPTAAWRALIEWIEDRREAGATPVLRDVASRLGHPDLVREIDALQRALVSDAGSWSGESLLACLRGVRKELGRQRSASAARLAELNPG